MAWTSPKIDRQVDAFENLFALHPSREVLYFQYRLFHYRLTWFPNSDSPCPLPMQLGNPGNYSRRCLPGSRPAASAPRRRTPSAARGTLPCRSRSRSCSPRPASPDAALVAIEDLVLADLRGRGLVLHARRRVLHLDVRERVRAALVAQQQRIALRVVARVRRRPSGSSPGRDRCSARARPRCPWTRSCCGVLADVDHLGAGVGLLVIVGQRHRVELAHRVVAQQDAARVFPGDRRAGLHLRPGNLRVHPRHRPRLVTKL
jgi:hypothetical protein